MLALRRRLRAENGAAAVEFAMVLVPLTMFLLGIAWFGIALFKSQALQAAAREGARAGALQTTTATQIRTRVDDSLPDNIPLTGAGARVTTLSVRKESGATSTWTASTAPCSLVNQQTQDIRAVRVGVTHSVTFKIFSYNPTINLSGLGEFKCE